MIICSQLNESLGPGLARVIGEDDLNQAVRAIERDRPSDTLAAAEVVRALERGSVYFLSALEDEVIEDLGLLPVSAGGVSRLTRRYDSCIVLANAQYAQAQVAAEQDAEASVSRERQA